MQERDAENYKWREREEVNRSNCLTEEGFSSSSSQRLRPFSPGNDLVLSAAADVTDWVSEELVGQEKDF